MIDLKITVTTDDGETGTYPVTPKVQVEFERQHKTGIGKAFSQDLKMEHVYWLGWCASKYAGKQPKPFDTWLDTVAAVEIVDESSVPLDETA